MSDSSEDDSKSRAGNSAKKIKALPAGDRAVAVEIYFLDYYWDLLTYISERRKRKKEHDEKVAKLGSEEEKEKEWNKLCQKEHAYLRRRRTRLKFGDFEVLAQIGKGGYGDVFLSRKSDTREIVALKRMRKRALLNQDQVHHIFNERNVLSSANSHWLVKLLYSFQDTCHVYLAMEYVAGGDMRTLLSGSGVLHEHHARFYMMEMVYSVAALHRLGYIHRDLKPENFLIGSTGHLKLTDFGLAKGHVSHEFRDKMKNKLSFVKTQSVKKYASGDKRTFYEALRKEDRTMAFSLVGSPDYMAPEMLTQEGYDHLVDYWGVGCIFFEFLAAFPPFGAPTIDEIWVNVYHWKEALERPVYTGDDAEFNMSDNAWDLITKLITDKSKRLSSLAQVQEHPWFSGADWESVRDQTPPFIPDLNDETDTTYFDDFENPDDLAKYKDYQGADDIKLGNDEDSGTLVGAQGKRVWVGWTYRNSENRPGHYNQATAKLDLENFI